MIYLTPTHWKDYRLIDSGNFEKLEQFGSVVTRRPEPQAVWDKSLPEAEWQKRSTIDFVARSSNSGDWIKHKPISDSWTLKYNYLNLTCNLKFTSFKHVGIFPEQAVNWDFMIDKIKKSNRPIKVLNLFAYTGGATMACSSAGAAEVVHVDAAKTQIKNAVEEIFGVKVEKVTTINYQGKVKRQGKYEGRHNPPFLQRRSESYPHIPAATDPPLSTRNLRQYLMPHGMHHCRTSHACPWSKEWVCSWANRQILHTLH